MEFGILIEISDHLFRSYPVIRGLSHLSAGCVYLALFMFYVLPPVLNGTFGSDPFREFAVRVAVTQATMLLVFLAIAHHFDVSLGRNIIGLCAGFAILEAGGITNFGLPALSDPSIRVVTRHLYPTIGLVAMIAWTHGLWRLDPSPELGSAEERNPQGLVKKLKNLNEEIVRLLK